MRQSLLKWSEACTVKFVEAYRDNQCLWDRMHPDYKQKFSRELALNNIIKIMDIEGFGLLEAKIKIKNLRSTYNQELIKIEKSQEAGNGASVYMPAIKWFNTMFSMFGYTPLERRAIVGSQLQNVTADWQVEEIDVKPSIKELELPINILIPEESNSLPSEQNALCNDNSLNKADSDPLSNSPSTSTKRIKLSTYDNCNNYVQTINTIKSNSVNYESNNVSNNKNIDNDNEYELFGKHVAMQLSKLSMEQYIMAQQEIQSVLSKCRLKDLAQSAPSAVASVALTNI